MTRFNAGKRVVWLAGSVGALIAAVACGDSTGNRTPATLAPAKGNNSTIIAGSGSVDTLAVTVLDAKGNPLAGVTVQWSIESGTGGLNASTSISDDTGVASILFTPASVGQDVVTAAYSGDVKTDLDVTAVTGG